MTTTQPKHSMRLATLMVVFCLLLPSVVKFTHAFAQHHHEVCAGEAQSHLHNVDLDCNFYKFKLNHNFYIPLVNYELQENFKEQTLKSKYYTFLKSHQQLTSYLRGPPSLVSLSK